MTSRPTPAGFFVETLENRTLLSAAPLARPHAAAAPTSKTTLQVSRHTALFGQDVTVSVNVKAPKKAGTPAGTVQLLDGNSPIQDLDGSPLTLTLDAKGRASYRFGAGDLALFVSKHQLSAHFASSSAAAVPDSTSRPTSVNVKVPKLKMATDQLQVGTVHGGKGKATVKAGQSVTVAYTGFLAGGQPFDYSTANHGPGAPTDLTFTVQASPEQVIQGFDEGVIGMKSGETRVLVIPPTLGYGSQANGPIPADSTLVFLVTLLSAK